MERAGGDAALRPAHMPSRRPLGMAAAADPVRPKTKIDWDKLDLHAQGLRCSAGEEEAGGGEGAEDDTRGLTERMESDWASLLQMFSVEGLHSQQELAAAETIMELDKAADAAMREHDDALHGRMPHSNSTSTRAPVGGLDDSRLFREDGTLDVQGLYQGVFASAGPGDLEETARALLELAGDDDAPSDPADEPVDTARRVRGGVAGQQSSGSH